MIAPSPNSGHTATLCSAKIPLRGTSDTRRTLYATHYLNNMGGKIAWKE